MSRTQERFWLISLYLGGFPEEAEQYTCTIKALNENNKAASSKIKEWTFKGNVIPLTTDESKVTEEGIGLLLTDQIVKKIMKPIHIGFEGYKIDLKVQIEENSRKSVQ